MTKSNDFDWSRLWIVVVAAIRIPSAFRMTALSIPWSSVFSISSRSPIVCVIGRKTNTHFSLREGRGTVRWGSPWCTLIDMPSGTDCDVASFVIEDVCLPWANISRGLLASLAEFDTFEHKFVKYVELLGALSWDFFNTGLVV